MAYKILSLNKRQTFPIVFDEVYFLARKGQQSYSHTEWLQSVTVKASFLLYSLDSQNVIFLGK